MKNDPTLYPQMLAWAKNRVDRFTEEARLAANAARTAERDLVSIQNGKPSAACITRYYNRRGRQPKEKT